MKGKNLPILASAALVFSIFILLYFQGKAGDNEVLFAHHSEISNSAVLQYLIERRSYVEREGRFPHDAYYFEEILKLLKIGADDLEGEEKAIIDARITLMQNLKPLVVNFENGQQAVAQAGIFNIDPSGNPQQLERRKRALQNLLQNQRKLEELEKNLNWLYAKEMRAGGVEGWKIERELKYAGLSFLGELRGHWGKLMLAKRQGLEIQLGMLTLLEDGWGLWLLEPQYGAIIFSNKDAISVEFKKLGQLLTEAQEREKTLFKELRYYY